MQHKHEEEPIGDVARWEPTFHLHALHFAYIFYTFSAYSEVWHCYDLQSAHPSDRLVIEEVFIGEAASGKSLESFGKWVVSRGLPALLVQEQDEWNTVKKKKQVKAKLGHVNLSFIWIRRPQMKLF